VENVHYDTDLTDAQWAIVKPLLPRPAKRVRPPKDRRLILDAILYIVKTGSQWRYLPRSFGPWQTVFHIFRKWIHEEVWQRVNGALGSRVRKKAGRKPGPTAGIMDSQSVKSDPHGGPVGYDGAKKIKGRKRHIVVDVLGLLLCVLVTPADTPERAGGTSVIERLAGCFSRLRKLWADSGYCGENFARAIRLLRPLLGVEIVRPTAEQKGFAVQPHRWAMSLK